MIEEQLVEYKMLFAIVMKPWETFVGKVMR
jgi:hypothetical protein